VVRGRQTPLAASLIRLAAGVYLSALLAGTAGARQTGPGTSAPSPGTASPKREAIERQGREAMLRGAELSARSSDDQRGVRAAAEQVRQDFKRIQVLRNNLARHLTSEGPLDYKTIADTAGELNKRANRLRTHLAPQTSGGRDERPRSQIELDGELMRAAIITLCRRIDSFTRNPVFKVLDVIDVEQSSKAGGDLQGIIRLSARIKEDAERVNKTLKR
jgi:NAD(P)-dependent dehydrogenase (short-subunit alcohol dehydrogenase family)